MVAAEIILIIIGIVAIVASFYITEKLSQQDLEQISLMSEADLKKISENQVKEMKDKVENALEDIIDESLEVTQRGLEKETNNKIMAVSEYSETVLESIHSAHNEITFLYTMLNDKQNETAELVGELQRMIKEIRDMDLDNTIAKAEEASNAIATSVAASAASVVASAASVVEKSFEPMQIPTVEVTEEEDIINDLVDMKEIEAVLEEVAPATMTKNEQILLLYKEGKDEVEIAKTLDCGLGEVRLVIGLYNEA